MLGEGQQEEAFELSLEMADWYLEVRGMPREGTGCKTSLGVWFVVHMRKGGIFSVDRHWKDK